MFTQSDRNYLLNLALVIVSAVCIFTGFYYTNRLRFAHEISGYLMAILILIHLVLHVRWIKGATKSIFSDNKKLLALILTLFISIGVCIMLFANSHCIQQGYGNQRGRGGFGRQFRN